MPHAAQAPRVQYTSSSFAQMLVGLFAFALRPQERAPRLSGPFPAPSAYHSEVPDAVLDRLLLPLLRAGANAFGSLRFIQRGSVQAYLGYILFTLVLLLVWK